MISNEQFSGLIGRIYNCAIDPDLWSETMCDICAELECLYGALLLLDPEESQHRFVKTWNTPPDWISRHAQYNDDLALIYRSALNSRGHAVDEPMILSRDVPQEIRENTRYFQEWCKPQGICDGIHAVVLHEPPRVGFFSAVRHEGVGYAAEREMAIMRLLAPHIRRAVTISDLMDMQTLEAQALATTLDGFTAGIIVVADHSRILHANLAAQEMLARQATIRSVNGMLTTSDTIADAALAGAVSRARRNESGIESAGISVALRGNSGELAMAHVLPLARGDLRTRLMPQATAAIFVTDDSRPHASDLAAIAASLGFTQAEARLVEKLMEGATLASAAHGLGIAETTAKTHLSHIFSKAGVSRQTDLIALVHRLMPPVRPIPRR
jgi:DNA-binding CsgD family transcriptional regulator/PAS domain-containing protein